MEQDPFEKWISGMFDQEKGTPASFFDCFAERLVSLASLSPTDNVLDVATGQGSILKKVADVVGTEGNIVGIDINSAVLEQTFKKLQNYSNIKLFCMDAQKLEFGDNAFDAVFCGFALYCFANLGKAVKEFFRVLKPGGKVYFSTWKIDVLEPPAKDYAIKYLTQAGFIDIEIFTDEFDFVYPTFHDWYKSPNSSISTIKIETLTPQQITDLKNMIREGYVSFIKSDGLHEQLYGYYILARKPL